MPRSLVRGGTVPPASSGSGGGAPDDAQYLVAAANGDLTAERVPTNTATVEWDFGTAAQAKANVPDSAITYAKIQNVSATDMLLGRSTAGAGVVEEIPCTAAGRALLDDAAASNQRTTLGLGSGDSPQFTAIEVGHASDTTLSRASAGNLAVEGNALYRAGGTDVPIADGGTGQSTATAAFDALAPTTSAGDTIYHNGTDNVRLAKGTAGQFYRMNSGATAPEWTTASMLIYAGAGDTGGYAPAAGSNFYFGIQFGLDPNTTDGGPSFTVPVSGTIVFCTVKQSTLGTNGVNGENITYRLRKNATTDSDIITTLDTDVDNVEGTNNALNFAVTAGDSVAVKGTPPGSWTTPPTVMFWSVVMRLDVP